MGEPRVQPQGRLGGEGERALRADDELREVVARRGLHELAAGAQHLAGAEHGGEAEHLVAGDAVAHRAHAAGVGGHVAAQAGGALAGEHRVHEAVRLERLVELVERDPGLHDGDVVGVVDLEDLGHALERHEDAVGPGDARAGQAGARAAGGDRHAVLGGPREDGRHLVGVGGPHDGERHAAAWR